MKVLYIIGDLDIAEAERMLQKLILNHQSKNIESQVIVLRDGGPIIDELRAKGIKVHVCLIHSRRPSPFQFLRLRSLIHSIQPDLISAWMYHSCLASLVSPKRIPLLWCIRQSLPNIQNERPFTRLVIKLVRHFSKRPDAIVFNSMTSLEQHRAQGFENSRMLVIPNGFEVSRFRPSKEKGASLRKEIGLTENAIILGHVSRFHEVKGIDILLEAFSRLAKEIPHLHLVMIGDGLTADKALISKYIDQHSGRIHALGARRDMATYMPAFDFFVLSSKFNEGFPNVLGEALCCEVPCIATDLGDVRLLLEDVGIIVPPNDVEALRKGLHQLISPDPSLLRKAAQAGRKRIEEKYSLSACGSRYIETYESLVKARFAS